MSAIKTILFPTDFSECSRVVFPIACSLAHDRHARLLIMHVVPSVAPKPFGARKLEETEILEAGLKNYREEMRGKLGRLEPSEPGVTVEHVLQEGDPATMILRTANQSACDVIIMGTHGRTGAFRQLMGSVADQVSRQASCPVLTCRMGGATSEPAKACLIGVAED
jgi:nucleotide-binding universal stress UspA family protein